MFVIEKNNKILLTKGDTATIKVVVFDVDEVEYEIKDTDTITMTVKKMGAASSSFTKTGTSDHFIIINPADTSSLTPGLYCYDVQLKTEEGQIYTIVPTSFLDLLEEVTTDA